MIYKTTTTHRFPFGIQMTVTKKETVTPFEFIKRKVSPSKGGKKK